MSDHEPTRISRRRMLGTVGKAAVAAAILQPMLDTMILPDAARAAGASRSERPRGEGTPVAGEAGVDRIVVLPGKTYLRGWAGYGEAPHPGRWRPRNADSTAVVPTGPAPKVRWRKRSGPGRVTFANPTALETTATFTAPGTYVLELLADNGETT